LTRGIECNTAYVTTEREPDEHGPERLHTTAAEVLGQVLENDGAQKSALLEMRAGLADAASIANEGTQWDLVSKEYAHDRYTDVLADLFTPDKMDNLTGEYGYERFLRSVREAEWGISVSNSGQDH
jgi:hypothetical protein